MKKLLIAVMFFSAPAFSSYIPCEGIVKEFHLSQGMSEERVAPLTVVCHIGEKLRRDGMSKKDFKLMIGRYAQADETYQKTGKLSKNMLFFLAALNAGGEVIE